MVITAAGKVISAGSTYCLKSLSEHSGAKAYHDIAIFTILGLLQSILTALFVLVTYHFCLLPAAAKIHSQLVHGVICSPMYFFDTTSTGQILNRFTNDISKIDGALAGNFLGLLIALGNLLLVLAVLIGSSISLSCLLVPLGLIYWYLQSRYLAAACQLRRIELDSRAPIINTIQEAWSGYHSIIIYGQRSFFLRKHYDLVNRNIRNMILVLFVELWLNLRLEVLGR